MSSSDILYSCRFDLPELIERDRNNILRCPVYRLGAIVAPTSGNVSVYNEANEEIVSAAAVSIVGSVAQYTVLSSALAASDYGDGWRVEWILNMPDGTVRTFDNEAMLVRRALFPVVTEADLYRVVSSIDPANPACIHSESSFSAKIDEAWIQIQNRMLAKGNRPNLVLSPTALRDCHLYLVLALIFEDFSTRLNVAYSEMAAAYRAHYGVAWADIRFSFSSASDDGTRASQARKGSQVSTLWLSATGGKPWRY